MRKRNKALVALMSGASTGGVGVGVGVGAVPLLEPPCELESSELSSRNRMPLAHESKKMPMHSNTISTNVAK